MKAKHKSATRRVRFGPRRMTLADGKKHLRALGLVLAKKDGEYRVNLRGGREGTAYYTDDLSDAIMTGESLHKKGTR